MEQRVPKLGELVNIIALGDPMFGYLGEVVGVPVSPDNSTFVVDFDDGSRYFYLRSEFTLTDK